MKVIIITPIMSGHDPISEESQAMKTIIQSRLRAFGVIVIILFTVAFFSHSAAQSSTAQKDTKKSELGPHAVLKGEAAYGDWRTEHPGVFRLITAADLPKAFATESAR